MPKSQKPVPAVLFLSGSGPNDKDETVGPNKPFADIARGLGDRGIASLRFDKRFYAIKDKSKLAGVTLKDEYYDDAAAALALLSTRPGVDASRIFVLGHSEGAMVAPNVAAAFPRARGIVMLAPGVRPIDAMLIDQMEFGAKLTGRSADEIAEQTRELTETFAAIRDPSKTDTPPFMGAPAAYWREVIALDVAKMVRDSKLPILVLQGDQDIQVKKEADFELLRARAGDSSGRVTYRNFAGLNHLFMKVERESTGAEYGIPGHVDPAVVSVIADWILLR
jgi:pimeloyl-ACP methyl ester carboxylesterase